MHELPRHIPDADVVLALSMEELGGKLLFLIKQRFALGQASYPGGVNLGNMEGELSSGGQTPYGAKTEAVRRAVAEGLAWLDAQVLLVPAAGTNGRSGWRLLSRRAEAMQTEEDFERYRSGRFLQRELLHPSVAEPAWLSFVRGEYDTAAFQVMRQVEIAIRDATGIDELGVRLARAAFKPESEKTGEVGPLTDRTLDSGEQQGMMDLFAGALAALKNPHSHRAVNYDSPADAAAVVMFGSQLLRIVEKRANLIAEGDGEGG